MQQVTLNSCCISPAKSLNTLQSILIKSSAGVNFGIAFLECGTKILVEKTGSFYPCKIMDAPAF